MSPIYNIRAQDFLSEDDKEPSQDEVIADDNFRPISQRKTRVLHRDEKASASERQSGRSSSFRGWGAVLSNGIDSDVDEGRCADNFATQRLRARGSSSVSGKSNGDCDVRSVADSRLGEVSDATGSSLSLKWITSNRNLLPNIVILVFILSCNTCCIWHMAIQTYPF